MKTQFFIIFLFVLCSIGCIKKTNTRSYFEPTGITNRTNEFSQKHDWVSLKDKEQIDAYTRIGDSIFGGEIACNIKPLSGIDIASFKVCTGTQYAKDTLRVYYPIIISCIDYEDCGVCAFSKYIIEEANPQTFVYLEKDYAKDKRFVYFRGERIVNADPISFEIVKEPNYFYFAKDKNLVYKHGKVFRNADASSFRYDPNDVKNKVEAPHIYIIKDKNHTWEYSPPDLIKEVK